MHPEIVVPVDVDAQLHLQLVQRREPPLGGRIPLSGSCWSTRLPRVVSRHQASAAEGQRVDAFLQQHEDPLDLGLHGPGRVRGSRAVPLKTV